MNNLFGGVNIYYAAQVLFVIWQLYTDNSIDTDICIFNLVYIKFVISHMKRKRYCEVIE